MSDIVATILIVMITVVLAAVLYLLVVDLTHGGTSSPLGSEFSWGAPINATGTNTSGCAATDHYCYHIAVAYAGSNLHFSSLTLSLQSPAGLTVAWPTSVTLPGGYIELVSVTSAAVVARYWTTNSTWQVVPSFTGNIASGFTFAIYCGGAAEGAGQGLSGTQLVAIGANGYSGTVSSTIFP